MKDLVISVPDAISDLIEANRKEAKKTHVANKFFERLLVIGILEMFDRMQNDQHLALDCVDDWNKKINWEA